VRQLEQRVEVGLVVGRTVEAGARVADDDLHRHVGGLVLAASAVARDVERETGHPVEATSYPSFTGLGPALVLVDRDELKRVADLRLTVSVNGRLQQDVVLGDGQPADPLDVLRAASRFQRLDPGDLVLTGTRRDEGPPLPLDRVRRRTTTGAVPRPATLRDGDTVQVRAATGDGTLDLGAVSRVVLPAPR